MPPFFLLLSQLLPGVADILSSDKDGGVAERMADAVKDATAAATNVHKDTVTEQTAAQAVSTDQQLKLALQQKLAEIALEETKERNRVREEQQQVELELQKLDAEERDREREAEFRRLALDMQDRTDARSRQAQLAEDRNPLAWVAPIIAFALVALIFYLLRGIMVAREPVINKDVFNVVLGALVTAFTTVITFYFGSSVGSRQKDDALSSGRLVANPNAPREDGGAPVPDPVRARGGDVGSKVDSAGGSDAKPAPLPPSSGSVGTFRQKAPGIMRRLRDDLGLSPEQAAGVLGNIGVECDQFRHMQEIRPIRGRGGFGWMQWTGPRRVAFEAWAQQRGFDIRSDDANYGFLVTELKGSEARSLASLRRQTTAEAAAEDFMEKFERPGVPNLGNRARLARVALADYKAVYNA